VPRWLRRKNATQRYKRERFERLVSEVRKRFERELRKSLKQLITERLIREHGEIVNHRNEIRKEIEEAKKRGQRISVRRIVREHLIRSLVDDDVLKLVNARHYTQALILQFLKNSEVEARVRNDRIITETKKTFLRALGITNLHMFIATAMLRYFRFARKVFSFMRNPTIKTLVEMYLAYEQLRQVARLPPFTNLLFHEYCVASRDLVKFDFRFPSRIYLAASLAKITYNVAASFGMFAAVLALVGNMYQKYDGEWITSARLAQELVRSLRDKVVVARTDDGRTRIEYPLFFVMYRPDRVEVWFAKTTGRRELRDSTVHCSVYRAAISSRYHHAPRISTRTTRYKRLNIYLPMRWFPE